MHEMAEKCATAIKNQCAPKQNKKAQTKWMKTQHTAHSTENPLCNCVEKSERVIIMRRSRIRICHNGMLRL